ncbi:hypothetical protein VNO78_02232 [Psophocarpus tetragonolobus]|uniref:Uncharacterized protein n=1 Tax=Psophocarpus tetragonolobus TaxID=3891 RepID=A0AAN9SZ76_PSOTE
MGILGKPIGVILDIFMSVESTFDLFIVFPQRIDLFLVTSSHSSHLLTDLDDYSANICVFEYPLHVGKSVLGSVGVGFFGNVSSSSSHVASMTISTAFSSASFVLKSVKFPVQLIMLAFSCVTVFSLSIATASVFLKASMTVSSALFFYSKFLLSSRTSLSLSCAQGP